MKIPRFFSSFFVVISVLLIFSCSSAPKPKEEVTKARRKAVEFSEYGNSYFNQGIYEKALQMYNLALAYNGSVDHQTGIAQSYNSIGKTHLVLGEIEEAEAHFNQAYDIATELDDPRLIVQCLTHTGELHLFQEDFKTSLDFFMRAVPYLGRGVQDVDKAVLFHNIGTNYKRLKETEQAMDYLLKAVGLNKKLKNSEELATNYYILASLYSARGEYETALEYASLALESDKKVENSLGIAKDHLALGLISRRMGNDERAFRHFQRSLRVYRSMAVLHSSLEIESDVKTILTHLIDTAEALGKNQEAGFYRGILSAEKE